MGRSMKDDVVGEILNTLRRTKGSYPQEVIRKQLWEAVEKVIPEELKEDGELPSFLIGGHNNCRTETLKALKELILGEK